MIDIQSIQVRWYRKYGRFPERITKDINGKEYVIGDWSWNRKYRKYTKCPHCGKPMSEAFEEIDEKMKALIRIDSRPSTERR